jgi:hypothetical protein
MVMEATQSQLSAELAYFIKNQVELVRQYPGMFLIIKNQQVIETYPTMREAYVGAQKTHELGTFMIQQALPGPEAYTHIIHRARFV